MRLKIFLSIYVLIVVSPLVYVAYIDVTKTNLDELIRREDWKIMNIKMDRLEQQLMKCEKTTLGEATYYEITAYCLNKYNMASGKKPYTGAVACPIQLKLGTIMIINKKKYICEDRMGKKYRNGKYLDIWLKNCDDAINFGRQKLTVDIL